MIAKAKLAKQDTATLISEYDETMANRRCAWTPEGRPSRAQLRIDYLVDLIDARADNDDPAALAWFASILSR